MSEELTEFPAYRHTKEKLEELRQMGRSGASFGAPATSTTASATLYGISLSHSLKRLRNL